MKSPLTLAGIEPATFRFVTEHLNHCATAVPLIKHILDINFNIQIFECFILFYILIYELSADLHNMQRKFKPVQVITLYFFNTF